MQKAEMWDAITEGVSGGFKAGLFSALGGLFLQFTATQQLGWTGPILGAIIGGIGGFLWGYFDTRSSQRRRVVHDYAPGSMYNPHPFQSSLWYQHERLMQAERDAADRRRGA